MIGTLITNLQQYRRRVILTQASEWVGKLDPRGPRDPETEAAFARWLLKSKAHQKEFLFMTALDEELRYVDPARRLKVE